MKLKKTTAAITAIFFFLCYISSCLQGNSSAVNREEKVKEYFFSQTDSLLASLALLDSFSVLHKVPSALQDQFAACRFRYKKMESIIEYYFQGLTKRINGPALPDVKTEDGVVWPPHGFQLLEQYLYGGYTDSVQPLLVLEIKALKGDLLFVKNYMQSISITPNHMRDILQQQFIRIAVLGVTGFDAPLSKLSLPEAKYSLQGIGEMAMFFEGEQTQMQQKLLQASIHYLEVNADFDTFNRLEFLTSYLMPVSDVYSAVTGYDATADSLLTKPFKGTLSLLLQGKGFNGDFYSPYAIAKTNLAKIQLGKQLFFDNVLSRSGTVSCGSCHQPDLYFTDGRKKASNFVHGGSLLRNTPSLYYAGLQSHQFYDLRSQSIEDQVNEVIKSDNEFNFSTTESAQALNKSLAYVALGKKAFPGIDSLGTFEVRNALAAFVRSLSPFSSTFDAYMQGNKQALSEEEIKGFNLFAGKAKCATCHFIPLFNGNNAPWYTKSESEIIGVPASPVWENASIDPDSGRYRINRMTELMFSFKTPTLRNVEKTAPYMHNGVYNNLTDVVEFYQRGGGVGIGINLPFQSLPFDSLSLNAGEKKSIIAFMHSLTDKNISY